MFQHPFVFHTFLNETLESVELPFFCIFNNYIYHFRPNVRIIRRYVREHDLVGFRIIPIESECSEKCPMIRIAFIIILTFLFTLSFEFVAY